MSLKVLVTLALNISDKDLFDVGILENDAALSYALLFFPLAALDNLFNPFSTNVLITDKPGSWFLLAKCLKNTCRRVTFQVKMQVIDYIKTLPP